MIIKNGELVQVKADDLDENGRFIVPYNVKSIGASAFFGLASLKEVSIGKNVKSIGDAAFEDCDNLKSVTIYGDLNFIGQNAFYYCSSLEDVNIEGSVKKIKKHAFDCCSSLRSILLPNGLTQIDNFCFNNCISLDKAILPDSLSYIGNNAFANCNLLHFIELPDNVTFLGENAFYNCISLFKVKLPEKLEKVPSHAFYNCGHLEEVEFGKRLTFIDERAFSRSNIRQLKFPKSLIKIGKNAFSETYGLKEVIFDEGIKELDENSFRLSELEKLNLPESLEYIGFNAFSGNDSLKEVRLPSNLQTIGDYAFANCKNLTSVTMPSGELGAFAFLGDNNLSELRFGENCKIDMDMLAFNFSYLNRTKDGFILESTPSKNGIPLSLLKELNPNIIITCWDKKEKILQEIENNEKITILYNTLYQHMSPQQFSDFVDNKNMKFFNQLCKLNINSQAFESVCKIFYNLGGFNYPVQETRISKSGNKITQDVDYAQIACEFLKEKINRGKLDEQVLIQAFKDMNAGGFKRDFARFFVKNFDELVVHYNEKEGVNFIARCYNDFDAVQRFNTSNKGSQRQLAPTISKFDEYFNFTDFTGINEENSFIAQAISPFFKTQEAFALALGIYDERKKSKTPDHILKIPLVEKPFKKIDNLSRGIKETARDTVGNMVDNANEFTYEWLSKNDPQNLIIGKLCNCCAHLEGVGYGIMHASIVHPNVQNLVVRNKNGEIVAKATLYVNRKNGYGVFNTFKIKPSYNQQIEIIYKKLVKGARAFIREYNKENPDNPLTKVSVGKGFNDFEDIMDVKLKSVDQVLTPIDYSRFGIEGKKYEGDSYKEQYLLWEEKQK